MHQFIVGGFCVVIMISLCLKLFNECNKVCNLLLKIPYIIIYNL